MSRTTLQVPFSFDKGPHDQMPTNHPIQNQFSFAPFNGSMGQKEGSQGQVIYPQSCGSNLKINLSGVQSQNQLGQKISNNHIPAIIQNQNNQIKRNKCDPQFQSQIYSGHQLVNLQSENSYEFVIKNFPFLKESEIKNIITDEDHGNSVGSQQSQNSSGEKPKRTTIEKTQIVDKKLSQLKINNLVAPYMASQQKKLGIQFNNQKENNQNVLNSKGKDAQIQPPRATKKRGRRQFDQDLAELSVNQPDEMPDREMNSQVSSQSNQQVLQSNQGQPDTRETQMSSDIEVVVDQDQIESNQIQCKPQMNQQQHQIQEVIQDLQLTNTPNDKFFSTLESNLKQFMDDRKAAYQFISNELKTFKDESNQQEMQDINHKLEYHQWATSILKRGVKIQNKKLNENDAKAKHFDELFSKYKTVEQKNQEMELQLAHLKTMNEFLLKNQIGESFTQNYNQGNSNGFGGFGGGIC